MRRSQIAAAFGVVLLMSWPAVRVLHSDIALYTIEDLGTLNGAPLTPRAINGSGHVAGMADVGDGTRLAFLADSQPARDLGSLGWPFSEANAINDRDEVVGFSLRSDSTLRAFRYTAATGMQELVPGEAGASFGFAINASGQVAGYGGAAAYHAFRYENSTGMIDLGTLGGFASYGYGINEAGHVTGCSWTADGQQHAFVWDGAGPMLDLGTLGGQQSCGVSINRDGRVAGWSFLGGDIFQHAFRSLPGGGLQDLGTLGGTDSFATGINDNGTVVGWSMNGSGERRAFVFTDADGMIDLNQRIDPALGWTLTEASGINATGQIVGTAMLAGAVHAFRMTPPPGTQSEPVDSTPPAISSVMTWPSVIWPPHHEMVQVGVLALATDDSAAAPSCRVAAVTSSEPDTGTSNQDRPNDIVQRSDQSLELRAELGLKARERVYTIDVACADAAGNQATARTTVRVVKTPSQIRKQ